MPPKFILRLLIANFNIERPLLASVGPLYGEKTKNSLAMSLCLVRYDDAHNTQVAQDASPFVYAMLFALYANINVSILNSSPLCLLVLEEVYILSKSHLHWRISNQPAAIAPSLQHFNSSTIKSSLLDYISDNQTLYRRNHATPKHLRSSHRRRLFGSRSSSRFSKQKLELPRSSCSSSLRPRMGLLWCTSLS